MTLVSDSVAAPTVPTPRRVLEGYFPPKEPGPLAPTLGPIAVRWIESNLVLGEGDYYGQPYKLLPWMKRFLYHLLELEPEELPDGTPWAKYRYKRALLGMPKGSAKGPLVAGLSAWTAFGPSQFDGWDEDGEPKATTRTSPVVQVAAASWKQAGLLFNDCADAVRQSPTLGGLVDVYQGQVRIKGRPGVVERIYSSANSAEGSRPLLVCLDEGHEWVGPRLNQLATVLQNGLAKRRDSLAVITTTAGALGGELDDALARRLYLHGKRVSLGEIEDRSFLMFWAECLTEYNLDDPVERRKAVLAASPSAGAPFFLVDDIVADYDRVPRSSWERYRLNRWVSSDDLWIKPNQWAECKVPDEPPLQPGEKCVLAVDGSWSNDATAIVAASLERPYVELLGEWRPPPGFRGEYHVPIGEVERTVIDACSEYQVREVAFDPARFGRSIDVLSIDHDIPVSVYPQSPQRMVPSTQRMYEAILGKDVHHNGDARLAAAVTNAVPKTGTNGVQLTKPKSGAKIDAAVAMIMAWDRAHTAAPVAAVDYFDIEDLLGDDDPREGW